MYSVYGKKPVFKGETGFPPTQTEQRYHTLNEILDKLVQDGKSLPAVNEPEVEGDLDHIDPTQQRGFDIADLSLAQEAAREAIAADSGIKWSKSSEVVSTEPILSKEKGSEKPDADGKSAPEQGA